jgi:hypothetical protein
LFQFDSLDIRLRQFSRMKRRGFLQASGGVCAALMLAGCAKRVDEYRYRLVIEFDTPLGVKSASSVIRATRQHPYSFDPFQYYTWSLQGDAIFVDLGSGKHAVALLTHGVKHGTGDSMRSLWVSAYGYPFLDEGVWSGKTKVSGLRELSRELVPTIVTFTDISDPATAKVIFATDQELYCRPDRLPACVQELRAVPINEIASTLGHGYALRRAVLELVPNDTPVTRGIEQRLPSMMAKLDALNSGSMSDRMNAPYWVRSGHLSAGRGL